MNSLYQEILEEYEFDAPLQELSEPQGDRASSAVRIATFTNGEKWVIKGSTWYQFLDENKATLALETVYEVSELLRLQGVPLPEALKTKSGQFTHLHGGVHYTIQKYVAGRIFSQSTKDIMQFGKALGIFHRAGRKLMRDDFHLFEKIQTDIPTEKPYEESRILYDALLKDAIVADHICGQPDVCALVRVSLPFLEAQMRMVDEANLLEKKLTTGILHNDLNTGNILLNDNGTIAAVIDVDQLGTGFCIIDVANTINSFAWELGGDIQNAIATFIIAYHKENPLPTHEYSLIGVAGTRWDLLRILRTMRRHHFENDRLPKLLLSIKKRFMPRLGKIQEITSFMTPQWVKDRLPK